LKAVKDVPGMVPCSVLAAVAEAITGDFAKRDDLGG
jgi:hypothetical protein